MQWFYSWVETNITENVIAKRVNKYEFDGDQVTVKAVYYDEANAELRNYINSKRQFLSFNGTNMRELNKQGYQCTYNLTLAMPDTKITPTKEIKFG